MSWLTGTGLGLALALGLALCPAVAQETPGVAVTAMPGWVDDLPVPPDAPEVRAAAVGGVHYLLSDHQLRWTGDTRDSFGRTVLEVLDRAGLEQAATISLDFDPATETMDLVRLVILREGREIDLSTAVRPEVFRREGRLDEGIVDGTLTAWYQIPGLRVGDVVDYASVLHQRPLFSGPERAVFSTLEWEVPVVLSRTVVLWPQDWPQHYGALPDRVARMEGPGPDATLRLEFQRVHHIPPPEEEAVPTGADPTAFLRLSAEADWGSLSAALTPHYAADYPLPPEWEDKVQAIAAASPDPATRAIAALRLVQDELRYVSLSMGDGGYFARPPEEVIASGYGDCKDKSLLLVVMLRRLGIAAEVALTDIDRGHDLPQEVPMPGVFDHAIVRLTIGGQSHWVDPTASHQGGSLATATPPDFGWGLPLAGAGQMALVAMPAAPEELWDVETQESYRFTAAGVFLQVETRLRRGAADDLRARRAVTPADAVSAEYAAYYLDRLPGLVALGPVEIRDDRAGNETQVREKYFLSAAGLAAAGLTAAFPFAAEDFTAGLPDSLPRARRMPLETLPPGRYRTMVRVSGLPVDLTAPAPVTLENRGFRYALTGRSEPGGRMTLDWSFLATGADVPAQEVAAFVADVKKVFETTYFTWDLRP